MTHLYAGGVLQQNVFNQLSSISKITGNSAYPKNTVSQEVNIKWDKEKKIGCYVKVMKKRCDQMINNINWSVSDNSTHLINPDLDYKFQQYLYKDDQFRGYIQLSIGTYTQIYVETLLEKDKISAINKFYQNIAYMLYNTLCTSSNEDMTSCNFEYSILKVMQNTENNEIDKLFRDSSHTKPMWYGRHNCLNKEDSANDIYNKREGRSNGGEPKQVNNG